MATTALRSRRARLLLPSLALLVLALLLLAATVADAARPADRCSQQHEGLAKKKHDQDDDDKPPPAPSPPSPGPDDDDTIAEMKACHAERGKGRPACLAVPRCRYCTKKGALPSWLPLPALCVHELEARLMPDFLWQCAKEEDEEEEAPVAPNGDACEGLHQGACAASKGVCVWCVAAAVPSSCFTVEQAGKLPPGVFDCGVAPSSSATAVF